MALPTKLLQSTRNLSGPKIRREQVSSVEVGIIRK
jgi:hypothetical protein